MSLKEIRASHAISQAQLAEASNVSQGLISRVESGRADHACLGNARAIVAGLNKLGVSCSFADVFLVESDQLKSA